MTWLSKEDEVLWFEQSGEGLHGESLSSFSSSEAWDEVS